MVRAGHHQLGDAGRMPDVLQSRHRTGPVRGAVHHRGIQFDDAFFVGQSAVAHGSVLGVILHQHHAGDRGIERIPPRL